MRPWQILLVWLGIIVLFFWAGWGTTGTVRMTVILLCVMTLISSCELIGEPRSKSLSAPGDSPTIKHILGL